MKRVMINDLKAKKDTGERISMVTAYDFPTARLVDRAGIDTLLVGDSLGMVIQGREDTLSVTVEEMIYHTRAVKRGSGHALIVTDMPFMSYQASIEDALHNAGKIIKEGGAGAVKLEGGQRIVPQVKALVGAGIPVMGHLGLTPQSVNQFSGFKVQGRNKEQALHLIEDALALESAGVFSIVLETVPDRLAEVITSRLTVPTIGIGAGPACDGQVLVLHDLLGFDNSFQPRFVRRYANLQQTISRAIEEYIADVQSGDFPSEEESFQMAEDVVREVAKELETDGDN